MAYLVPHSHYWYDTLTIFMSNPRSPCSQSSIHLATSRRSYLAHTTVLYKAQVIKHSMVGISTERMSTLPLLLLLLLATTTVIVNGFKLTKHALRKGHNTFHFASNAEFIPGEKANDSLYTGAVVDYG